MILYYNIYPLTLPARDLTLEAARDASFARKSTSRPLPPIQLKKLLDSRREAEVLDGLRRVVSVGNSTGCSSRHKI